MTLKEAWDLAKPGQGVLLATHAGSSVRFVKGNADSKYIPQKPIKLAEAVSDYWIIVDMK